MKPLILLADDDPIALHVLGRTLAGDYEVVLARDGAEAWRLLNASGGPRLAVLDWQMPSISGTEICKRLRGRPEVFYVILLTATRKTAVDVVAGFDAGADDYLTKPFDPDELRARVAVGCRVLDLQHRLAERIAELEAALARIRRLEGLLPICAWCKRIRNAMNAWEPLEIYLSEHSEATFTHGMCPECRAKTDAVEAERNGVLVGAKELP